LLAVFRSLIKIAITVAARLCAIWQNRFPRIVSALAKILRLDVADVQKPITPDAEINKRRLDARLQVYDPALVDVSDIIALAAALQIKLFQLSVFNNRNPALLRLCDVD